MFFTLFRVVSFSFLTDFYTVCDFLSQFVLNSSRLALGVCCGWAWYSLLRRFAVFFAHPSFKGDLNSQNSYISRETCHLYRYYCGHFLFLFSPLSPLLVLCELKSRFLELEVGRGRGKPGHVMMGNNHDSLPLLSALPDRSRPVHLCIPSFSCGTWCINGAQ